MSTFSGEPQYPAKENRIVQANQRPDPGRPCPHRARRDRSGVKVLFCGINPGLYPGAAGPHFVPRGNLRPALAADLTRKRVSAILRAAWKQV